MSAKEDGARKRKREEYRPRLDSDDERRIKYLFSRGITPRQIAFMSGRCLSSVYKILKIKEQPKKRPPKESEIDPKEKTPRSE
jgi:hypothetical protein